jgi:hypothetical protein
MAVPRFAYLAALVTLALTLTLLLSGCSAAGVEYYNQHPERWFPPPAAPVSCLTQDHGTSTITTCR